MLGHSRLRVACVVLATVGLVGAGCGDDRDEDLAGFRAYVREEHPRADADRLLGLVREKCDLDDDAFAYAYAATIDQGGSAEDFEREVSYLCPDRLEDLAEAKESIRRGGR